MKEFNWEDFKDENNKIAVHCKTEDEAKDFCKKMHEHGMEGAGKWDYSSNTFWDRYRNNTCYGNHGTYGTHYHFNEHIYTFLEWSDYMEDKNNKFTKADLKDGMVVEYQDKTFGRRLVVGDYLIGGDGYSELNNYAYNLINNNANLEIVKIYKIRDGGCFNDLMEDKNLKLIWERSEPKKMTTEEMRQKLEELTGEKIEVESSKEEMIGTIELYCGNRSCSNCIITTVCSGNFGKMSNKELKECYEKIMGHDKSKISE